MVSRDTGLVLLPWHHYNKTGEQLTLHMDTENRWPQARAQNNIYRLNRRPMYSSRKLTRTREGAGGSMEWHSWSQTCPGQGAGSLWLWEGGGGQAGLPASASKCLGPWLEQNTDGTLHRGGSLHHDKEQGEERGSTSTGPAPLVFRRLIKHRPKQGRHPACTQGRCPWSKARSLPTNYSASSIYSLQPTQISPTLGQKFSP